MNDALQRCIDAGLAELGAPYIWQGKGDVLWTPIRMLPHAFGRNVFDCSGFYGWCLKAGGHKDLRALYSADTYYAGLDGLPAFSQTLAPEPGDAVVYVLGGAFVGQRHLGGRADHIEMVMPDGRLFGAIGGNSDFRTLELAKKHGACVKYRAKPRQLGTAVYLRNPLRSA